VSSPADVPVVILCGGKGTRLGELGKLRPKPLVTIGGMPILWHIMKGYAAFGCREFILCLGYKGEMIEEYFQSGTIGGDPALPREPAQPGWKITFADTGSETGTSGRVARIRPHVEHRSRFFLTYGDGVSSVRIDELLDFHERMGKLATVTGVHPETTFGVLREEGGLVTKFAEKPRLDVIINGGFFVFERGVFHFLDDDGPLEEKPMARLTEGKQLAVHRHEGFWQCMDNQKETEKLNSLWERGDRPWAFWTHTSTTR
jgi:glucose-1-phosphate cytidylyltransferase